MSPLLDRTAHRRLAAALGFVLCLLVAALRPAGAAGDDPSLAGYLAALPRRLTFTFNAADYEIVAQDGGAVTVTMAGFEQASAPGDPQLPAAFYTVALPPYVPLDSAVVTLVSAKRVQLPGHYDIAPAGPGLPAGGDGQPDADWGPNTATIVAGRNTAIYGHDAAFPTTPVDLIGVGQLRQWRLARLRFRPVSYNPVTGQLWLTTAVTVTVRYDAPAPDEEPAALLGDSAAPCATGLILNFDEAQGWYEGAPAGQGPPLAAPTYAIVTTNQIWEAARDSLLAFADHKTAEGWRVQLYTEDEYGELHYSKPQIRAEQVRDYLRENYLSGANYKYVLLIGNPDPYAQLDTNDDGVIDEDPFVGDLPMKVINGTPTDFYFADLTNEDGTLDWEAEVYVGRIPVYQSDPNWVATLASILNKTIAYETSDDLAWRRSALLAMGFLRVNRNGADLGEPMKNDYLDAAGFSTRRLYWHGVLSTSFPSEGELVDGAVRAYLQQSPAGIMVLVGHGGPGNVTMYEEYDSALGLGDILISSETNLLDDSRPALSFQASCQTGWPEAPDNLTYALLRHGAVGAVGGARNTFSSASEPGTGVDNVSLGYHYMRRVVDNMPIGQALYCSKSTPYDYPSNALAYNLYGDPSLQLLGGLLNPQGAAAAQAAPDVAHSAPQPVAIAPALVPASVPDSAPAVTAASATAAPPATPVDLTAPTAAGAGHPRGAAFDPELLLSASGAHTCALKPSGEVECWTTNKEITDAWKMDIVDVPGPYVQVATSLYTSCGLRADGSVNCWGRLDWDGMIDRPGPYVQISMKYLHACGLRPDGRVECWGNNDVGQGDAPAESFIQVSTGMQHTCGLRANGSVACWGRNIHGQAEGQAGPFVQIDAGFFHTCGLRANGRVNCWGSNYHGQAEAQTGPFIQVSVGMFLTCGLRTDRSTVCWGREAYEKSGPFTQISAFSYNCGLKSNGDLRCWDWWSDDVRPGPYGPYGPTLDPDDLNAYTVLAAGANHTCGLMPAGSADCWGDNGQGQAGTHNNLFKAVAAGGDRTCALTLDGQATCWGDDDAGQDGPFVHLAAGSNYACGLTPDGRADCWGDSPAANDQNGPFVALTAGRTHTCALTANRYITCWGSNEFNQLDIPEGQFIQISAGWDHTCALTETGGVSCWGRYSDGQTQEPMGVYTQIAAGGRHTCALRADGRATCWGANDHGQSAAPPGPFVRLVAGQNHTCALRANGGAVCWGDDTYDQTAAKAGPFGPYAPHVNHSPVAQGQSVSTPLNTPVTITLAAADDDGDSLAYHIVAPPQRGTLSGAAPQLVYTPATGFYGFDRFTYRVNDGMADSNVAIVDITVTPVAYWELFLPVVERK